MGRGFHLEAGGPGPGAPHVYEYRRDNTVLAMKVDGRVGQKWEAELSLETEVVNHELSAIVVAAIGRLLADVSKRLLESVLDPTCRSAVAAELRRVVATLE